MRMLTERGLGLKAKIERMGYRTVECYPGAAQDIWGIPRQHHDLKGLLRGLKNLGVKGLTRKMTSDELDPVSAALTGRSYLLGKGEVLGGENGILIPESPMKKRPVRSKVVQPKNGSWQVRNRSTRQLRRLIRANGPFTIGVNASKTVRAEILWFMSSPL